MKKLLMQGNIVVNIIEIKARATYTPLAGQRLSPFVLGVVIGDSWDGVNVLKHPVDVIKDVASGDVLAEVRPPGSVEDAISHLIPVDGDGVATKDRADFTVERMSRPPSPASRETVEAKLIGLGLTLSLIHI